MIREAPHVHVSEIHAAGRAHGKTDARDGTRGDRAGALIAARVYRGDRHRVERARDEPREPEGDRLVWRWAGGRRCDQKEGRSWTGRARRFVVETIGLQVGQLASVGIRGRRDPGGVEDPGSTRRCREGDPTERQTETCTPPAPGNQDAFSPTGADVYSVQKIAATDMPLKNPPSVRVLTVGDNSGVTM